MLPIIILFIKFFKIYEDSCIGKSLGNKEDEIEFYGDRLRERACFFIKQKIAFVIEINKKKVTYFIDKEHKE